MQKRANAVSLRALSIRTRSKETEEEGERKIVYIGGNDYQRTTVKGSLTVRNFRSKDAVITIRREFSGELLVADGDPAKSLRLEGATSVNPPPPARLDHHPSRR